MKNILKKPSKKFGGMEMVSIFAVPFEKNKMKSEGVISYWLPEFMIKTKPDITCSFFCGKISEDNELD